MYAAVRSYSGQGASELFDVLGQREEDVKSLISGVPGFVSYVAFRSGDGGMTVTICEDKAGTDESSRALRSGSGERQHDREPARGDHGGEHGPTVLRTLSSGSYSGGQAAAEARDREADTGSICR